MGTEGANNNFPNIPRNTSTTTSVHIYEADASAISFNNNISHNHEAKNSATASHENVLPFSEDFESYVSDWTKMTNVSNGNNNSYSNQISE